MDDIVPSQFIASIRSCVPWYVPGRYAVAEKIFEKLVINGHIRAVKCSAYACDDGWCEGLGAGHPCTSCHGTGWVGY